MNDLIYWYDYIPVSQCCVEECHYLLILVVLYTEYTVGCVCLLYNGSVYIFDSANMIKLVIHTVPGSTSSQKCADLFAKILLDFGFFILCMYVQQGYAIGHVGLYVVKKLAVWGLIT